MENCFYLLSKSFNGNYFGEYKGEAWYFMDDFTIHDDYSIKEISWVANEEVIILDARFILDESFNLIVYDTKYKREIERANL